MMNSNWTVKTAEFRPAGSANKVKFDEKALQAHKNAANENKSVISSMLGSLGEGDIDGYDENLGDFNNRLGKQQDVPELGSNEAVQGSIQEIVGTPEKSGALDQDNKADFTVSLSDFKPAPDNANIDFDENALNNHRQNGLKGTVKSMLGNIIGMAAMA